MPKKALWLGLVVLVPLALFLGGEQARLQRARVMSRTLFYPFTGVWEYFHNLDSLRAENYALHNQVVDYQLNQAKMMQLLVQQKCTQLPYVADSLMRLPAQVLAYTGTLREKNIVVDKGLLNGVKPDLPVLDAQGVVGKTISSGPGNTVVLPINHPRFHLPVNTTRSGIQGMLETDDNGQVIVNLVPIGSDIAIGDTVVTSNLSGIFPSGLPVGVISEISGSDINIYLRAEVNTFARLDDLQYVVILFYQEQNYEKPSD